MDIINIKYDFIGLTECWKDEQELIEQKCNVDIKDYENIHSRHKYNQNGGLHLYVHKDNEWQIIQEDKIKGAESLEVEIKNKATTRKYFVILIYRSTSRAVKDFIEGIGDLLKRMKNKDKGTT